MLQDQKERLTRVDRGANQQLVGEQRKTGRSSIGGGGRVVGRQVVPDINWFRGAAYVISHKNPSVDLGSTFRHLITMEYKIVQTNMIYSHNILLQLSRADL